MNVYLWADSRGVGYILELLPQINARAAADAQQTVILKVSCLMWCPFPFLGA